MLCSNEMDLCFAFLMFFYLNPYPDEMDLDAEWSLCGRWRIKSYVETAIGTISQTLFCFSLRSDEMDLDAEWSLCGRRRIKSYVETSIGHYAPHLCFISILYLMRWIWMQNGRFVVDGI